MLGADDKIIWAPDRVQKQATPPFSSPPLSERQRDDGEKGHVLRPY